MLQLFDTHLGAPGFAPRLHRCLPTSEVVTVPNDSDPVIVIRRANSEMPAMVRSPQRTIFLWDDLTSPFALDAAINRAENADCYVAMGCSALEAAKQIASTGETVTPLARKTVGLGRSIYPGVDSSLWRPFNGYRAEFDRAELRGVLTPQWSTTDTILCATVDDHSDVPALMSTTRELSRLQKSTARLIIIRDAATRHTLRSLAICRSGSELDDDQLLICPRRPDDIMVALYNMVDVFIETRTSGGWPDDLVNALSSGCLVAASDDFVWAEIVGDKRGVEMPAGIFEPAAVGADVEFVRRIMPDKAAVNIAAAIQKRDEYTKRAVEWARTTLSWENCALRWAELLG